MVNDFIAEFRLIHSWFGNSFIITFLMSTVREQTCLMFPLANYMDVYLECSSDTCSIFEHVNPFKYTLLWQNTSPYYADIHQAVFEPSTHKKHITACCSSVVPGVSGVAMLMPPVVKDN
jgi:hypothetical protein